MTDMSKTGAEMHEEEMNKLGWTLLESHAAFDKYVHKDFNVYVDHDFMNDVYYAKGEFGNETLRSINELKKWLKHVANA